MKELTMSADRKNIPAVIEFVNQELDAMGCSLKAEAQIDIAIDEIYSKSTRKRKGSYENSSLVVMAPTGSAHLDGYQNRQGIKMLDYSSREPNVKTWTLVYGDGSDQKMLILELPDEVVQDMRRYSPQKVYLQ